MEMAPEAIMKYDGTIVDDSADGFSLYVSRDAGISFNFVKRWTAGEDFDNDVVYNDISVVVPNTIFSGDALETAGYGDLFSSDVVLKIQCEADDETDYVYIDNVSISGHGATGEGGSITGTLNFDNYEGSYLVAPPSNTANLYDYINSNLVAPEYQDLSLIHI